MKIGNLLIKKGYTKVIEMFSNCTELESYEQLLEVINELPNNIQKKIFIMYLGIPTGENYTQVELAKLFGKSQAYICRAIQEMKQKVISGLQLIKEGKKIVSDEMLAHFKDASLPERYDEILLAIETLKNEQDKELIKAYFKLGQLDSFLQFNLKGPSIRYQIIRIINEIKTNIQLIKEEKVIVSKTMLYYFPQAQDKEMHDMILTEIDQLKNDLQKDIIRRVLGLEDNKTYTVTEVSQTLGISRQWTSKILNKGIAMIKSRIESRIKGKPTINKYILKHFPDVNDEDYYDRFLQVVESIPNHEEKQIFRLYFCLEDGKHYTLEEISLKLNSPFMTMNHKLSRLIEMIKYILQNKKGSVMVNMHIVKEFPNAIIQEEYNQILTAIDLLEGSKKEFIQWYFGLMDGKNYTAEQAADMSFISRKDAFRVKNAAVGEIRCIIKILQENQFSISRNILREFSSAMVPETYQKVLNIVELLPDFSYRKIIEMYFGIHNPREFSVNDISKELNIPIDEVIGNINIGLFAIRQQLKNKKNAFHDVPGKTKIKTIGSEI